MDLICDRYDPVFVFGAIPGIRIQVRYQTD